jgi:hypothetical protein
MFGSKRPKVVAPFVMFLAVANHSDPGTQIAVLGFDMLFTSFKFIYVKGGIGTPSARVLSYFN